MTNERLDEIIKARRQEIYASKPKDVEKATLQTKGTFGQSFFPAIQAWATTGDLCFTLMSIRDAARQESSDLNTLKMVLASVLDSVIWMAGSNCGMEDCGKLLGMAHVGFSKINSKQQFTETLEQLVTYVSRLNYWLDEQMPWTELVGLYELIKS